MDNDHREEAQYYIGKLQQILKKVIAESEEFQALSQLVNQDGELHLGVFAILMEKNVADHLQNNIDMDLIQKLFAQDMLPVEPGNPLWSDQDRAFLKDLKISLG